MPKLKELSPEVMDLVRARLQEAARDERLVEWAALGFEGQLEPYTNSSGGGKSALGTWPKSLA
jgi:hypothetical protein